MSVLKIVQNEQKWLINLSEEPNIINATLDNRRSLTRFNSMLVGPSVSSYYNYYYNIIIIKYYYKLL